VNVTLTYIQTKSKKLPFLVERRMKAAQLKAANGGKKLIGKRQIPSSP
jgi:hypothetical protein